MRKRPLRWIDLYEEHYRTNLIEVGPFPRRIAASSPTGEHDDEESWAGIHPRIELVRQRMSELLQTVEPLMNVPQSEADRVQATLAALGSAYSELRTFRQSAVAWQDIHAADDDLMVRAENVFEKFDMRG